MASHSTGLSSTKTKESNPRDSSSASSRRDLRLFVPASFGCDEVVEGQGEVGGAGFAERLRERRLRCSWKTM